MRLHLPGRGALALALVLGAAGSYGASGKRPSAEALFDRAYSLTNVTAKGSPPFVLKAKVTVYVGDRHDDGEYDVTWESDEKVRREVSFPDYHEVTVTNAGKVWHSSTIPYLPYTVFQVNQALYFFGALQVSPSTRLVKVRKQKIGGIAAECSGVHVKREGSAREFCFDPTTGYPIEEKDPTWFTTLEFGDYMTVGTKAFPRTFRVLQNGQLIVEAKVTDLIPNPTISDDLFAPLPGAEPSPSCEHLRVERARLLTHPEPRYLPMRCGTE